MVDFAQEHCYYIICYMFSTMKNKIRASYLEFGYDFHGLIF